MPVKSLKIWEYLGIGHKISEATEWVKYQMRKIQRVILMQFQQNLKLIIIEMPV